MKKLIRNTIITVLATVFSFNSVSATTYTEGDYMGSVTPVSRVNGAGVNFDNNHLIVQETVDSVSNGLKIMKEYDTELNLVKSSSTFSGSTAMFDRKGNAYLTYYGTGYSFTKLDADFNVAYSLTSLGTSNTVYSDFDEQGNAYLAFPHTLGNALAYNTAFTLYGANGTSKTLNKIQSASFNDIIVAKLDSNGNLLEAKNFGIVNGSGNDIASTLNIAITSNGIHMFFMSKSTTAGKTLNGTYALVDNKTGFHASYALNMNTNLVPQSLSRIAYWSSGLNFAVSGTNADTPDNTNKAYVSIGLLNIGVNGTGTIVGNGYNLVMNTNGTFRKLNVVLNTDTLTSANANSVDNNTSLQNLAIDNFGNKYHYNGANELFVYKENSSGTVVKTYGGSIAVSGGNTLGGTSATWGAVNLIKTDNLGNLYVIDNSPTGSSVKKYFGGTAPSCGANPGYIHATYTEGNPTNYLQSWSLDSNVCGFACIDGYTGNSCEIPPAPSCVAPPLIIHATFTFNPNTYQQNWIKDASSCGYACTDGYTGASCETEPVVLPGCSSLPNYVNATYNEGSPIEVNQSWIKGAESCGFVCINGYTGNTCEIPPSGEPQNTQSTKLKLNMFENNGFKINVSDTASNNLLYTGTGYVPLTKSGSEIVAGERVPVSVGTDSETKLAKVLTVIENNKSKILTKENKNGVLMLQDTNKETSVLVMNSNTYNRLGFIIDFIENAMGGNEIYSGNEKFTKFLDTETGLVIYFKVK